MGTGAGGQSCEYWGILVWLLNTKKEAPGNNRETRRAREAPGTISSPSHLDSFAPPLCVTKQVLLSHFTHGETEGWGGEVTCPQPRTWVRGRAGMWLGQPGSSPLNVASVSQTFHTQGCCGPRIRTNKCLSPFPMAFASNNQYLLRAYHVTGIVGNRT